MKQRGECPRCGGRKVGELDSLPDAVGRAAEPSYQALGVIHYVQQVAINDPHDSRPARGRTKKVGNIDMLSVGKTVTKSGTLEARVCTECGLVERYVQDPGWVPFAKLAGFSWVNPEEDER